jgi:hypothetical protein
MLCDILKEGNTPVEVIEKAIQCPQLNNIKHGKVNSVVINVINAALTKISTEEFKTILTNNRGWIGTTEFKQYCITTFLELHKDANQEELSDPSFSGKTLGYGGKRLRKTKRSTKSKRRKSTKRRKFTKR